MQRPVWGWVVLAVLAGGGAARAEQCTFIGRTGAKVSPRSGRCNLDAQAVKEGQEICTQDNRTVSDTSWRKGERQGPGWYLDYNDQKLEVRWKGEVADGPVKVFAKTGSLLCTLNVVNGKTEGVVRELWPSGHLKQEGTYQPCRSERCFDWPTPDGTVREYAEEGRLVRESQYKAGELNGIRRFLHRNGKPVSEETFAKGQLRKLRCWGADGQLQLEEEYFEDGSRKSGTPPMSREERAQKGICQPDPP